MKTRTYNSRFNPNIIKIAKMFSSVNASNLLSTIIILKHKLVDSGAPFHKCPHPASDDKTQENGELTCLKHNLYC